MHPFFKTKISVAMAKTQDLSLGVILRYNGNLCQVEELDYRSPGNKRAFFLAKLRNLISGQVTEARFRSGEAIELARVEYKQMQFLYANGDEVVCMDPITFDQVSIPLSFFGEKKRLMKEGIMLNLGFESDIPIAAALPQFVELKITYTEPGLRGDTATRTLKQATVETGTTVQVPLFINQGDIIRIDTRTGSYVERAK